MSGAGVILDDRARLEATIREQLSRLTPAELAEFRRDNREKLEAAIAERRLYELYPDIGVLRRELYPKHLAFFRAGGSHEIMVTCPKECGGAPHNERAFIAGNRVGKSTAVAYELACHMTGWYAPWWTGRRFQRPVSAWAAGEDAKAVRESLQKILLGPPEKIGTGLIPKAGIISTTSRTGVPDAMDTVTVKYQTGGVSRCVFKSYDQGRESFQGAAVDIVVFDEEPPMDIYSEGATRTLSTVPGEPSGIVMCAFTPLRGISDIVLAYLPMQAPSNA